MTLLNGYHSYGFDASCNYIHRRNTTTDALAEHTDQTALPPVHVPVVVHIVRS